MAAPLNITPDQATCVMLRLQAAEPGKTLIFDFETDGLHVPDEYVEAVKAILAVPGWDTPPAPAPVDVNAKFAAYLKANPDVLALIGA